MPKYIQHIIFWVVLYFIWSYMKSVGQMYPIVMKVNLLNVGIYIAAYYSLRHILLPLFYNKKKYILFGLTLFSFTIIFYLIWRMAGVLFVDAIYYPNRKIPFMQLSGYLTQTVQFYSPAILLLVWENYNARQSEKLLIERLENEKLNNELKFLKAQINPHFLFNTLNNLYSFVLQNSPKAPDMIMRLSKMLDYILYKSQKKNVSLQEEIDCVKHFIALEKLRYGDRLSVHFEANGDKTLAVSPLIILSIVENAFKHGASGDIDEPKIDIQISTLDNQIKCSVWNTKSKLVGEINDAYKEGIGLKNIKRQLKLIYGDNYQLDIDDQAGSFKVDMKIKSHL